MQLDKNVIFSINNLSHQQPVKQT